MTIENAKARARQLIFSGEGFIAHMYLDSVSQVTIGYGTMLPDAASTGSIRMYDPAAKALASSQQKMAEWRALRKLSAAGTKINYKAAHYASTTKLVITQAEGIRLFNLKLEGFLKMLQAHYKGFDNFPEDAQVAMLDMAYNLGNKIHSVFKSFSAAVNDPKGPDWERAAKESHRPQLSDARNKEVRELFLKAREAKVAA